MNARLEASVLLALGLGIPAALLVDAFVFHHGLAVIGFPLAIALVLEGLLVALAWQLHAGRGDRRPLGGEAAHEQAISPSGALWLAGGVAVVLVMGPRLGLSLFAGVFAWRHGARPWGSVLLAVGCWLAIEALTRYALGVSLPDFPLFGG